MKTIEELNALKKEVKSLKEKLSELTDEEMKQIFGGAADEVRDPRCPFCGSPIEIEGYNDEKGCYYYRCSNDGIISFFWKDRHWEKGRA